MAEEAEAAEGGADAFEQEMEAARVADEALGKAEGSEGAQEGAEAAEGEQNSEEGKAEAKPPLDPEELAKRNSDLQKATRAERQKRRDLERTVSEMRERLERFEASASPQKGADGETRARPDPSEDPIGYLEYVESMLSAADAKTAEERQQEEARATAQRETQAVISQVAEFENDFRELNPDYDDAVEHLYGLKKGEYEENGYSPDEAHAMVMGEFLTRAKRAFAAGKDPAEIVYSLAKKGGYAPKSGEQKLEAVERGQRATSALSQAGGGGAREMTPEAVSRLNGAAFDTAFAKLRERALQVERTSGL